ncbi:P-loop containing nucleoside triphosphate hydrolase protein [Entophlyctis helioformis]|nr:P-loop containing nucleoside triphosphate hydrolase protein [Entophlyctis helioformis]
MQEEVDLAKEETEQLQREATQIQEQMVAADQQIETLAAQIRTLEEERKAVQSRLDAANERWNRERATVVAYDNTMSQLEEEKRKKTQTIEDGKHELQKLRHEVGKLAAERDHAVRLARDLEAANVWISDQKQFFNEPDTEYDFSQADISERKKRLAQLSEQHASLSKSVDPQVLEKYERVEKREASLKQRLATVRKDKSKIQETISTLDELKREKLVETWTKVNRDFGLIFADLLPGNTCKLEPPEGQDITAGLEVKVSLGGKWKQSLTELSGGQRSLIALSLILSLLQFKPAPMYILDEVDSALDLSHTQNIGQLLKSRFRGSQFIVVSLKDGMFNNANVLFRTKFVDGVSKVDRTQNRAAVADARGGAGAGGSGKEFATPVGGASGRGKTVKMLASRRQSMLSELNI